MGSRWKMNRMGFVNFWLYDDEVFSFADGKLLLRGQNGSGKSITTQSFIPFILDGDRTPSRLDPFGSSDRKMEYYFLGEEGKDESTGYLFLEFHKENTDQYRTIGIGQRAQRGKPMGFWGFVLLDGRRIGYDLWLDRKVGGTRIPYDKQELKKQLGGDVPFTDVPGEYKRLVNQYIFGFPRMEQYEQFIRLLVKVRAPKLSKEFKPTKVYDILNESLQTLTDEDLRAMVDAMEKMDDIQNNLEHLREAFKEVQALRVEYTRYNQYMIGKKAQAYLDGLNQAEQERRLLESDQEKQKAFEKEQEERKTRLSELEQEFRLIQIEIESLHETDLDEISENLIKNQGELVEVSARQSEWRERIAKSREQISQYQRDCTDLEKDLEYDRYVLNKHRAELEELEETLQYGDHQTVRDQIARERCEEAAKTQQGLKDLRRQIANGERSLQDHAAAEKRYDEAAEELSGRRAEQERLKNALKDAEQKENQTRDQLVERQYEWEQECREWKPKREELKRIEQEIIDYREISMASRLRNIYEEILGRLRSPIRILEEDAQRDIRGQQANLVQLEQELQETLNKKELEPARRSVTEEARKKLTELGISFVPFYQSVEFAPGLSDEACAQLETQLLDAGLLDALVVAERDMDRALAELGAWSDVVVCAAPDIGMAATSTPFEKLIPNEELEQELKLQTKRILRCIEEDHSAVNPADGKQIREQRTPARLILHTDGFFQNGIFWGHSIAEGEAGYVGRLARQRRRQQKIALLQEQIDQVKQVLEQLATARSEAEGRLVTLEREYQGLPDLSGLDQAMALTGRCRWHLDQGKSVLEKAEKREQELMQEKQKCYQQVLSICKGLPYGRTLADYQEALSAADDYLDAWEQTRDCLQRLEQYQSRRIALAERMDREEEVIDTADQQKKREENRAEELKLLIQNAEEFLNRPENREIAKRLNQLKQDRGKVQREQREVDNRIVVLKTLLEQSEKDYQKRKETLTAYIGRETRLRACLEAELNLGLIIKRETKTLTDCAKEALTVLRESDKNRNATDMTTSLLRVYQQHSSGLASYGTSLEECFDEVPGEPEMLSKRQQIVSICNGKKLYLDQFHSMLKNQIEETELLIREKDRELFENILSRTLSEQLTMRIRESREWIGSMSKLMQQMDTSMALSFSLDWKPGTAENDQEMDTRELEKLLLRDKGMMTSDDIERLAAHFRSKIRVEKQKAEESGGTVNYMDLVRDALDYRKWFEFQMYFYRNQEGKKPLTNAAFNKFSGGEKAMAMYVPLFAAVNAQYQKAQNEDHPRIVALDEAFAGVDDKNISTMFELVGQLDFDYIMNSQALWGCYQTVPALRISELLRPANSQVVTVVYYTWNGREKVLDEQ